MQRAEHYTGQVERLGSLRVDSLRPELAVDQSQVDEDVLVATVTRAHEIIIAQTFDLVPVDEALTRLQDVDAIGVSIVGLGELEPTGSSRNTSSRVVGA